MPIFIKPAASVDIIWPKTPAAAAGQKPFMRLTGTRLVVLLKSVAKPTFEKKMRYRSWP